MQLQRSLFQGIAYTLRLKLKVKAYQGFPFISRPGAGSNFLLMGTLILLAAIWSQIQSSAVAGYAHWAKTHQKPDGCVTEWEIISSPNVDFTDNFLLGLEMISQDDIWTVGGYRVPNTNRNQTLIEHWDGVQWSIVPSPNETLNNNLRAVAAVSSNNVWAVGSSISDSGQGRALIEHWDGTQWSIVASPDLSPGSETLYAVAAVSANDVWAVGSHNEITSSSTYVLHWDGTQWSIISAPSPGTNNGLFAIEAISADGIWAVGGYGSGPIAQTLTLHWNGVQWEQVPSPTIGTASSLSGITALSSSDIWAVGGSSIGTLTMHWDGTAWSVLPSPNMGTEGNTLYDVAAITSTNVWAVGTYSEQNLTRTLTLHWDGAKWTIVPSPSPASGRNDLRAVAVDSFGTVWAVGTYIPFHADTFVLRYQLSQSCPTPTPTSTPNLPITPTSTHTRTATRTQSPIGTITFTPTYTVTGTPSTAPSASPPPSSSSPVLSLTPASTSTPNTHTPTSTATRTSPSTRTPTPQPHVSTTPSPSASPIACAIEFTDVPPNSTFYPYIQCLACLGIVNGYPDNTFHPSNPVSRGQIAKIVANSAAFTEPVSGQSFQDVPPAHTFYTNTQRLANRAIMSGYPCGALGEPCIAPGDLPYFRPASQATRAQVAKIVAKAIGYEDPPSGQTFEDVPPGSTFYLWVENLANRAIMSGYPCGGPTEPCNPPTNLPYFRSNANATRGQVSKIVTNTFFPTCSFP